MNIKEAFEKIVKECSLLFLEYDFEEMVFHKNKNKLTISVLFEKDKIAFGYQALPHEGFLKSANKENFVNFQIERLKQNLSVEFKK